MESDTEREGKRSLLNAGKDWLNWKSGGWVREGGRSTILRSHNDRDSAPVGERAARGRERERRGRERAEGGRIVFIQWSGFGMPCPSLELPLAGLVFASGKRGRSMSCTNHA